MKCNTMIQEDKDEGQGSGDSSEKDSPGLSIQVKKVNEPWTTAEGFFELETVIGPVCVTSGITASESRSKVVWYVELFSRDVAEYAVVDSDESEDRDCDSKIGEGRTSALVTEEWGELHTLQLDSKDTASDGKDKTEEGSTCIGICGYIEAKSIYELELTHKIFLRAELHKFFATYILHHLHELRGKHDQA